MGIHKPGKIETHKTHDWIRQDKTNKIEPSRNIYVNYSANRYFSSWHIVGVKTPRYLMFFLQGKRRRQRRVVTWLASFKSWRVFHNFNILIDVYILFLLVIIIMNKRASRSGKQVDGKAIGTWVRIPGPPKTLILFFLIYSRAEF